MPQANPRTHKRHNRRGLKHGLKAVQTPTTRGERMAMRYSLPAPRLPKGYRSVAQAVDGFRLQIENAVLERHGEVTILRAAWIGAACDHERGRQFILNRLREVENGGTKQDLATIAAIMKTSAHCADKRNHALERLGLDAPDDDPWASLNVVPALAVERGDGGPDPDEGD
jgi:hypothetical protein